jgi:glycosyltransferase involved in cell wall biosynthesis
MTPDKMSAYPDEPLVTVVVPVFNTETFLEECLESIRGQTYGNWEAVVVNNCSTDRSGDIADRFVRSDSRFRVVHCSEFLGQLDNYNRALRFVSERAQYCKMVEADNWIYPECIEKMVALAETDKEVSIVGSYYLQGETLRGSGLPYTDRVMEGRKACRLQLLESFYFWGSPTCLLYRADTVRSRAEFFNPQAIHADRDVCYELLEESKFGFVHQVLSFLREDNESISTSIGSFNPHLLSKIMDLHQFGARYLTKRELDAACRYHEHRYFNYLGLSRLLGRRDPAFWAHHEKGLNIIGMDLKRGRLLWWGLRGIVEEALLEPKAAIGWLRRAWGASDQVDRGSRELRRHPS